MKARNKRHASYVQTLVYYDGPVLALLQDRKGNNVVAFAVPDGIEGFDEPFIAKSTSPKLLSDYLRQRIDLSYLMRERRGGEPYLFDWAKFEDEVQLVPAETVVEDVADLLPSPGFFARNHTEQFKGIKLSPLASHTYRIDGRWSANDFSRFYAKLDDLYSLFSYLDEVRDATGPLAQKLVEKIAKYPWQRGGSYLGFFRDIAADSKEDYPLQVSKIKYASPGVIEVKGVNSSLLQIDALVGIFDSSKSDLSSLYRELHGILDRDGVLGTDAKEFSNKVTERMAEDRADRLLEGLNVTNPGAVKGACQHHLVPYSKIALAIYRRGEEFHRFHAEGRMRLPSEVSSSGR
ncbi:hypothetical protein EOA85_26860 [Mesorhizobium sp. M5C.F.Ca.IN.020.29.1.1]|uniref:hypothetical protein n=1 Tax=unclassified Mesorhizobium TaxID=325217 RepID=UPI000FCBC4D6|nr:MULTISPECIES: hypothetical protein [unclassified Mesorhizobium]RUV53919.1 hypothetical protein EOA85_26860 [Mesorhizobium sp. M5C.F.Ca.IN.020.29.1.1]TIM83386.1 MAG: hypothetical protein E5Y50_25760 [Mesorhizobium sp.]